MCVKREPGALGKIGRQFDACRLTRVSAAGHVIHFHRMKGMLLLTLPFRLSLR
jgi:hypothetical protein